MKNIQITTDRETAEICGYALMGCANRLSAAITSPSAGEELKKSLRQDLRTVEKIVTAFAHADIVNPQGSPSGDDNNQDAKSYVGDHHRPVAVGQTSNKPLSEDLYPLDVVEFIRPNGKQENRVVGIDPMLGNAVVQIFGECARLENRGRFTFENCGAFWNLCFECEVEIEDDNEGSSYTEVIDVVSEIVTITFDKPDIAPVDWTPVIEGAAKHLGLDK